MPFDNMFVLDNFKKHGFSQLADGGARKLSQFWTSKKWLVGKLYHCTSHLYPLCIPCVSIYIPLRSHLHTICIYIYIYICIYIYIYIISSISGKEHWYIFTFDKTTHPVFFPVISVPLRSANVTGVGPRKHIYNVVPWCPPSYMLDSAG